jgi:hypothetical protein
MLKQRSRLTAALGAAMTPKPGASAEAIGIAFLTHHVLPFLTTLWNYTKQGIGASPLGVAYYGGRTLGGYRASEMAKPGAKVARADNAAKMAMATATTALGGWLAVNSQISGDGPSDPGERRKLIESGWQSRSIKVGNTWYSYDGTPVAIPFSMMANAWEAYNEALERGEKRGTARGSAEAMAQGVVGGLRGGLAAAVQQSFARSLGDAYRVVTEDNADPSRFMATQVGRYIPASGMLAHIARSMDPLQRDPKTVGERVAERLPGPLGRNNVPVRQTALGETVPNQQAGLGAGLLPFPRRSTETPRAIETEMERVGIKQGDVGDTIRGQKLNPSDARAYREKAAQYRGALAEAMVASEAYQDADDDDKRRLLEAAMRRGAAWASHKVLPGANDEGAEILRDEYLDPRDAVAGYVSALETDRAIRKLDDERVPGMDADAARAALSDRSMLARFREVFGEAEGDMMFIQRHGRTRWFTARRIRENPLYRRRVEQLQKDPDWQIFIGAAPRVIRQRGLPVVDPEDLESA